MNGLQLATRHPLRALVAVACLTTATAATAAPGGATDTAQPPPPTVTEAVAAPGHRLRALPTDLQQMRDVQQHVQQVLADAGPATVALRMGAGSGSGVIVSPDGLILTAGHVIREPNRNITVIFPDGREVRAVSLGAHSRSDSGMARITEPGEYPFVPLAQANQTQSGEWVVALGHPGGYRPARPLVARLGRIVQRNATTMQSDCTLIGGDSGGPLLNLDGELVGIHSRIANATSANFHVPASVYHDQWERLAAGELWGLPGQSGGYMGVSGVDAPDAGGARIDEVFPGTPAERAGLRMGDVITAVNGRPVRSFQELARRLARLEPGDRANLALRRGSLRMGLSVLLGSRP